MVFETRSKYHESNSNFVKLQREEGQMLWVQEWAYYVPYAIPSPVQI